MLLLTCLVVLLVLAVIMVRGSAVGSLDTPERLYLVVASIPAILALVLPSPIAGMMQDRESANAWGLRLNEVGGWLSLGLIVVGALLLSRRSRQGRGWDRRLLIGLFVAALPAILICLVALMYALRG